MKRKLIAITGTLILSMSMATSAFAVPPSVPAALRAGYGCCGGYGIRWDEDGNFLDKEAFEANLNKLIEDGVLRAEDKDYYLSRYDWCVEYGGNGRGMRRGMGRSW